MAADLTLYQWSKLEDRRCYPDTPPQRSPYGERVPLAYDLDTLRMKPIAVAAGGRLWIGRL